MILRPSVFASAVALVMSLGVASGRPPAAAAATAELTRLDQVYAQSERSLDKIEVYHQKITISRVAGTTTSVTTMERWVDASRQVSRDLVASAGADGTIYSSVALLASNIRWVDGTPLAPSTCHHISAAAADVLGCPSGDGTDDTTVTNGHWHGRRVLVLTTHLESNGDYADDKTTSLTYLDPVTAMPLGGVEHGTRRTGAGTVPLRITSRYSSQQLRRASLPRTFFTAAALGWKLPNPLTGLPHGIPVYWPGRTWSPGGGLPGLTLQSVQRLAPVTHPLYQEILEYARKSDPYGPAVLSLQLWKAKDWAAAHVAEVIPLCKPVSRVAVALGMATFRCPTGVDGPFADVDAPGAHLTVDAPSAPTPGGIVRSPYGTVAALTTVLNALRVRR